MASMLFVRSGSATLARLVAVLAALTLLATPSVWSQEALYQEDSSTLHRRVLTLPDSVLYAGTDRSGPVTMDVVPTFSIFYVFAERSVAGESWVEVGSRPLGGGQGWLPKSMTEEWKNMLVMQYARSGQRERVLFFQQERDLTDLVQDSGRSARVRSLLEGVRGGRPNAEILAAAEPEAAVDNRQRPYLMPILDAVHDETFDEGTYTTLVQVGGLNTSRGAAGADASAAAGAGGVPSPTPGGEAADLSDFRLGVVFVIDTTLSMGPYIDLTYETVRNIYAEFEATGILDRVAFGLVGYRDYIEFNPALEYVTRVYQPLSLDTPPEAVLESLKRVKPSRVSTDGWSEDAYAGLDTAIHDLDWEPFSARIIVLVSDAGARSSSNPRVMVPNFGAANVVEAANRKRISLFPIHLLTAEAVRFNDVAPAERVYREIGRAGDGNVNKYIGVEAGSVEGFGAVIGDFAAQIRTLAEAAANNRLAERPDIRPDVAQGASDQSQSAPIGDMLVNEVFRAQLEYIGSRAGVEAPRFYRAWVADRDLVNPKFDALSVAVFLNRTQLSGLAQSLQNIVNRAKATDLDPGGFFDMLQSLAATMAADPNRRTAGQFDNLADSGLLPDYLAALPYHSKVMQVNRELWLDWGMTGQHEFILELEQKIAIYERINQDTRNWVDLGAGEPGLEVYPIPLVYLP